MKSFCIIGLGKFGKSLAYTLAESGNQVMVIDEDNDIVNELADYVTNAIVGDPANEAVLRAAGVKDYDCAIVCTAGNINDNILITLMLKEMNIPKVVARALDDRHKKVLERIGADMIVFPEQDMGEKLAYMLTQNNVTDYIEFSDDYKIVEVVVPDKWVGKNLIDLNIRQKFGVTIIAINNKKTGEVVISPLPTRSFEKGELISLIGTSKDIDKITKM